MLLLSLSLESHVARFVFSELSSLQTIEEDMLCYERGQDVKPVVGNGYMN